VKLSFLVQRIADQEKITVSQEDAVKRCQQLAMMYQMPSTSSSRICRNAMG